MRLLRIISLAVVSALAVPFVQAQPNLSFGFAGGLNTGFLSDGDDLDDTIGYHLDSSNGYHLGVFVDIGSGPFTTRWSVFYVLAGEVESVYGSGHGLLSDHHDLTFVAIPVDLKYRLLSSALKPYVLLGPEARFLTSSFRRVERAKSVAFGFNTGLGVNVGKKGFVELRYAFDGGFFEYERAFAILGEESGTFEANAFYLRVGVGL